MALRRTSGFASAIATQLLLIFAFSIKRKTDLKEMIIAVLMPTLAACAGDLCLTEP